MRHGGALEENMMVAREMHEIRERKHTTGANKELGHAYTQARLRVAEAFEQAKQALHEFEQATENSNQAWAAYVNSWVVIPSAQGGDR